MAPNVAGKMPLKGKINSTLERIMIEPHVLHISAEALTPELLEREEKLLEKQEIIEKRRKERLERLGRKFENNSSATSSRSSSIEDSVDESDAKTSSTSTSRSVTPTLKNGSTIRNRIIDGKVRPNKRKGEVHPQISLNESKKSRTNNVPLFSSKQSSTKSQLVSLQDTVLVRLSGGQVVRVPKSLLKRVVTATKTSDNNVNGTQLPSGTVIKSSLISTVSTQIQSEANSKTNHKSSNDTGLSEKSSISCNPVSTPFVSCLSEALEKVSCSKLSGSDNTISKSGHQGILNGIFEKLANSARNGKNGLLKTVKIRAYQGSKYNSNSQHARREFGVGKLSLQLKKVEQKLIQSSQTTVHVPSLGISKRLQPQMLMMSGGGNVTRVVIPKWLNVTVAPPSGPQSSIVSLNPAKQTQNIIRIRGPLPSRTQTHTQQNSMPNLTSTNNSVIPGSSLLLKEDIKSSQQISNVVQKVSIGNSSPLKLITGGTTRTFVTDFNGVLKHQHQNPQQVRVLQHQPPILLNNVGNNATVVNTLFKDTSGSPIVIKKSLVSASSMISTSAATLLNVSNNSAEATSFSNFGALKDASATAVPKTRSNVVIVENVNSSSNGTPNSFIKQTFVSPRIAASHLKSSVPSVVMVSKVDHNSTLPKGDMTPPATSVISSSNPIPGEVEFYDKEL